MPKSAPCPRAPHRRAAIGYHPDGRIAAIGSKATVAEAFNLVLAYQGRGSHDELMPVVSAIAPGTITQAQFIDAIPQAVRIIRDRRREQGEGGLWDALRVYVASHDGIAPRLYVIASDDYEDVAPYAVNEVDGMICPDIGDAMKRITPKGWIANPVKDSRRIFLEQRKQRFPALGNKRAVGGPCTLYTVTAGRIKQTTVCTFPDKIGDMLD